MSKEMLTLDQDMALWEAGLDTTDQAIWRDYRRIMEGQTRTVVREHLAKVFPDAWSQGAIPVRYAEVIEFLLTKTAPSFEDPLAVAVESTESRRRLARLMRLWRPALSLNWRTMASAGASYLHLAWRDRPELDHVYGDQIKVTPDPDSPTSWDRVIQIDLLAGDKRIRYTRGEAGVILVELRTHDGKLLEEPVDSGWTMMPVYPTYRRATGKLTPPPCPTMLDLQTTIAEMLSHIDHRRTYRVDKPVVTRMGVKPTDGVAAVELKMGMNNAWVLSDGESMQMLESSIDSAREIGYVDSYARMAIMFMGLPPELLDNRSRAETGAAKEIDYGPVWEAQDRDREKANEWLVGFIEWCRPALEKAGAVSLNEDRSVFVPPPRQSLPQKDRQSYAQGTGELAEMGLVNIAQEYARINRVTLEKAKKEVSANAKLYRTLTGKGDDV